MYKFFLLTVLCSLLPTSSYCQSQSSSGSTVLSSPSAEFLDGQVIPYSTKGHAKSKGAAFTIKYPRSWTAKEGERPNIVQKFISKSGKGLEIVMIITKPIASKRPLSRSEVEELLSPETLKESIPSAATVHRAKSTQIEGEPAGLIEYAEFAERAGVKFYTQSQCLYFIQGKTLIAVQFQVGGLASYLEEIRERANAFRPLFQLMMNSIVFHEKWK